MKSIKLAMILLVGQCVFNPLAALSEIKGNIGATILIDGADYSCYAVEKNGPDFYDATIDDMCQKAGYERQATYAPSYVGKITNQLILEQEAKTYNSIREFCLNLKANPKAAAALTNMDDSCARLGVLINDK